mgnify:CR=1 FL=1
MAKTKVKTRGLTDLNVTNAKIAAGTIDVTAKITGVVPAANLGSGTASSSTYLAGDSTYKTISEYDDNKLQSNIALLGFKCAVNGSLAKYNLQDQIIDEYEDATGIDASASTNENLSSGAYSGTTSATITGGSTAVDGDYTVHTITADGNFVTDSDITVDYLIVGGGGGGGNSVSGGGEGAGGGGGGGVISATSQSLSAGTFAVVSGDGGAAAAVGGDSSFNSQTAGGGGEGGDDEGGGGSPAFQNGGAGRATDGSAGGGGAEATGGSGDGNGNDGGDGGSSNAGGGGGGRGSAGASASGGVGSNGGDGGTGLANSITGSEVYYGAGGGGANEGVGVGGDGGSGVGGDGASATGAGRVATAGINGSGGGGGTAGRTAGGAGGDGVVIVRRLTAAGTSYDDLTLQSTDTTAMAEPDYADMVMLMENSAGTATINTDIKGWISKDSGSTFTQGTLVDEGTWGTDKKIYAFHDLDISAQSGTSMCYKITTHNQSEGSKETKIHATSIGWR